MGLHKLSAGDGYTYLTRRVAAADDTHRGRGSLGEYYEQKGESPGVWLGSGLGSLAGDLPKTVVAGTVTEEQMFALFGLGRHPNDLAIIRQLARDGASRRVQDGATKLGHAYHFYEPSAFHAALAVRYREFNTARGLGETQLSRTPSGRGSAANGVASGSARSTSVTRWTPANSPATSPASPGRRRCRWPGTT
jgi:hypothetical protein